jgi:hypothetical protein
MTRTSSDTDGDGDFWSFASIHPVYAPRPLIAVPVHGELAFKRRLADQTIRDNGFANGNSQGRLAEVLRRPLSPRVCRPIALDAREPRYSSF